MKKNVFKLALALCAVFVFGSGNLQDSLGANPVSENDVSLFFKKSDAVLEAKTIPPIIPVNPKISTEVDIVEKA